MKKQKSMVLTLYGHKEQVDEVLVNLFDDDDTRNYHQQTPTGSAVNYCDFINSLTLADDKWVFAHAVTEGERTVLKAIAPQSFGFLLTALDDRAVQKVSREVDERDLAAALTGAEEAVREKVFRNMSKNQTDMLKDAMNIRKVSPYQVGIAQRRILGVIRHLIECGEIACPNMGDECHEQKASME
jgi:flagellar motor switch protein FliG